MADTLHSTTTITGGHANAVAGGAAGFMTGADKTKLDGIAANAIAASGNLTGTLNGTAVATVVSGAAAGATALQPGGNLTGQVNGVAVATVTSGAALGATALQPGVGSIVNADVNAAAAIAGTKIAPDFGSQNITTTGNLLLGATPRATAGLIRVAHAPGTAVLMGRNAADSADANLLRWHSSQTLEFGEQSNVTNVTFNANAACKFLTGGNNAIDILTNQVQLYYNSLKWRGTVTAPILEVDQASAAAVTLTVKGQQPGSANSNGGFTNIEGGQQTGTGLLGGVRLRAHTTALVEAAEIAAGRRITALNRGANMTTTEMPASTGDLVTFIGNAATAPTANAVSGGILYSEAGALKWRGSGGTVTTLGPA